MDFIVPDCALKAARETLSLLPHLTLCREDESCPRYPIVWYHPPPSFHLHIKSSQVSLDIYPQSQVLWFLPPLDQSLLHPATLPPQYLLASDKDSLPPRGRLSRGSGAFASPEHRVVVLQAHVLLESCMRLSARDSCKTIGSLSMAIIDYVEQYVDGDGFLDIEQLPEPLRTSYCELKADIKPVAQWLRDLKEALGVPHVEWEDDRTW
ncbi:thioredoxin reductase [Ophiocordyceps sinensis CO18]|nr:thioredoxin reductase [Ophiocordyceps sinensis CO18]